MFFVFLIFFFNFEINFMIYVVIRNSFFLLLKCFRLMYLFKFVFFFDLDIRFVLICIVFFFSLFLFLLSIFFLIKLVFGFVGYCCLGSERNMGLFYYLLFLVRFEVFIFLEGKLVGLILVG